MASLSTRTISVVTTETTYITLPAQIPLTTTFTPPSTCLGPTFTISSPGYDNDYPSYSIVTRGADPRCFPPGFIATSAVPEPPSATTITATDVTLPTPSASSSAALSTSFATVSASTIASASTSISTVRTTITRTASATITQVTFSGIGCPESYTTATFTSALLGGQPFNVITCCPPSMTVSIPPSSLQAFLSPAISCVVRDTTIVLQSSTMSEDTVTSTVWAPAVLAISPTTSTTSTTGTPTPQNHSLSSGAKAGIGVGVALGVLLIIGAIAAIFFYRRRRKSSKVAELDEPAETSVSEKVAGAGFGVKAELPDNSKAIAELEEEGKEKPEMEGQGKEQVEQVGGELPAKETTAFRAELEGDTVPETRGDTLLDDQETTGAGKPA